MIESFNEENGFLSNFSLVNVTYNNISFPSVENAYQAAKCKYTEDMNEFVNISSGKAKRKGKLVAIRDDWEDVKISIMEDLIRQKFNQEPYKTKLINTGDVEIQEGNNWGDKFWGICIKTKIGENNLGKLIMKIREEIKG
jgi:ribA/ribD-fused uncharacterized protein